MSDTQHAVLDRSQRDVRDDAMRIAIVSNPLSGRGDAHRGAERAADRLEAQGVRVERVRVGPGTNGELEEAIAGADGVILAGGDGTLHHLARQLADADKPVYLLPFGTENLFAREFSMDRRRETLDRALDRSVRRAQSIDVDLARVRIGQRETSFVIMCSIGPDASVIHRLTAVREGRITHLSYAPHILAELMRPTLPRLRVTVDGEVLVDGRTGLLVVANCRRYALGLNPASRAWMRDGLVDVVFMPCRTRLGVLRWALALPAGRHLRSRDLVYERGTRVRVESLDSEAKTQIDGEAGPSFGAGDLAMEIGVDPCALRVMRP